ncbi:hypothetical protein [Sphingomonas sp. 3-13AW]|uniref:hypothetical protein n=1 Tax=Sphingomonas sp. 3-13AW TaxID=3050450 RepID=UPI003BB66737
MSIAPETLDEDTWSERYKPLINPVDPSHGFDFGDGCTLVPAYGDHLAYLATIPPESTTTSSRLRTRSATPPGRVEPSEP